MDALIQDLRYAVRALRARPSFTLVAVVTLAIGVGANTAIFSVVHQVLLTPPPFEEPDRVFVVSRTFPGEQDAGFVGPWSYPDFEVLRERTRTIEVAALSGLGVSLSGTEGAERVDAEMVSPNYFALLGVRPHLGRAFARADGDASAPYVAMLSHGLWQRRFGGSSEVIGEVVTVNETPFEVIGIAPAGFRGQAGNADLWVPIERMPAVMNDARRLTRPFSNWHHIIARIVAADASAAAAELDVIAASLADLRGETGEGARGIALVGFRDAMTDARLRQALLLLLAAVGLVLLIACANLASLLLTRAAARQREIAVRRALGAGRVRLVRQLVTESLTLAIAGGVAGLVVAWTSVRLLTWLRPTEPIPFGRIAGPAAFEPIVLDARVLAFNFGVALTAGVLFGLAPALVAARAELAALLRDVAAAVTPRRGVNRARGALVIGELAIALVLLAAAGLLGRSLLRLQAVDAGIDPERVLTAAIELPRSSYDAEQAAAFHGVLLERIRALPGVTEASVATSLPLARNAGATSVDIEGVPADDENPRIAGYHLVGGGYFGALGIPIERGRTFSERDRPGAPRVAIVNRTAERLLFPDGDALGRRIRLGVGYEPSDGFAEVVGVVGDVKYAGLDEPVKPEAYLAYPQFMENRAFLVLRSSTQPAALTSAVRRVVAELDPDLPVFDVRTMEQRVAAAGSHPRFSATLLGIFAAFALALAAVGVYGVVAYSVTSRMREIGIRRALGASDRSVLAEVMKEGALLAGGGVTLGLLGALAANRLLVSRLYDVTAADPATLATVATVLLLTAMLAAYLPSRRAVRIDPAAVLKDD